MKLSLSLVIGLLIFFIPYPSLKFLPEQLSQDVQPLLSGVFALLSLGFYLKRGGFRSSVPLSVIFPAIFLAGVVGIYLSVAIVESNNTPISLVIERTLAFLVGPIFYLSGVGIAYMCSKQPSRILKYFVCTLYILLIYGFFQVLGILLKLILNFNFIFDVEHGFRSLIMTRAQQTPRLVFFITEPSFLPSFLIFLLLTASTLVYFDQKAGINISKPFKVKNFLISNRRSLIFVTISAVVFSFSILVYMTAIIFASLFFVLNIVQDFRIKEGKKKVIALVKLVLLNLLIIISTTLLFTSDYLALFFKAIPATGHYSVVQRLSNLGSDPSTLVRLVKFEALRTCSVQSFPFGTGLGGYYNQSINLIRTAPSFQGLDISNIKQLQLESQKSSSELFSITFGTLCECGVFGFSGLLFMFLPSVLSCVMVFISPKANQASPLWPLVCTSGITTIMVFTVALPFALPYPWIVLGMCNYLLSGKVLMSKNVLYVKAASPYY